MRLMGGVLADALRSFQRNFEARQRERKQEFREARFWLLHDKGDGPFSFEDVCDALGNRSTSLEAFDYSLGKKQTRRREAANDSTLCGQRWWPNAVPSEEGDERTAIEANISQSSCNRAAQPVLLLFTPLNKRGNPASFVPAGNSKCESAPRPAHYAIIRESIPETRVDRFVQRAPTDERTVALRVVGLTKRYGTTTAVSGLNFDIHEGEIFGLLGPNGAGKTTTIAMLATQRQPSEWGRDAVRS